jgi:uncharacterized protein YggE
MRIVMAAVGVVFVGLLAVGVLGVASAETTPSSSTSSTQVRTVSVEGVATASIEPAASAATAKSVYREAMASAVADGKEKASFLAEKADATLGQVEAIAEGSGYIYCPGEEEYTGAEPDFGSGAAVYASAPEAARTVPPTVSKPVVHRKKKKHKRNASAKAASVQAAACTLSTQVSLAYELA